MSHSRGEPSLSFAPTQPLAPVRAASAPAVSRSRGLSSKPPQAPPRQPRVPSPTSPSPRMAVQRLQTLNDIHRSLPSTAGAAPLIAMSFVTSNCRACRYASAAFARLAGEFAAGDLPAVVKPVKFFEVDVSDAQNHDIGQRFGVDAVPSFQLFGFVRGAGTGAFGVLDELKGARVVSEVRRKLLHYSSSEFDLDDFVFDDGN